MTDLSFSAVVGQEDAKLALLLAAAQPRLGGVLLRGQKGSAKTTLARGLAALLPDDGRFVELPLGATEDRVLGSLDLAELLAAGSHRFRAGLLAAAHGGVLYVDEINLLADHLVDALLDVAASGVNRVERESVSHEHPARFVLVGSMNPEEGELRPQLLDRFGFAVDVVASDKVDDRVLAVRRQLAAEAGEREADDAPAVADRDLRERLARFSPARIDDEIVRRASEVALAVGSEGLRADLMLCRAAAALAGWEGRDAASVEDLRRVAPLVLAHRRRRGPFDEPGVTDEELDRAFSPSDPGAGDGDAVPADDEPEPVERPFRLEAPRRGEQNSTSGRGSRVEGATGRVVRAVPADDTAPRLAAVPTAVAVATRRAVDHADTVERDDLRAAVFEQRTGHLVVIVLDTSASMGAQQRIAAAKGAVLGLLTDAYQRRDRVALVAVGGDDARVVLRPTGAVEVARSRLGALRAQGATPLGAGLDLAAQLVQQAEGLEPLLVVLTDGRATAAPAGVDPSTHARDAAQRVARSNVAALVVDAEQAMPRLGLARVLAADLGAEVVDLDPDGLEREIRARLRVRG